MPSFIIEGYVWQILGRGEGPFCPPHLWAAPKNPILNRVKSADILLLNAFLGFVFCLVVSNNSWGRSFPSSSFKLILRVVPVLFFTLILHLIYCIQPFMLFKELLLFHCKILASFLLIFINLYTLVSYFLASHKTQFVKLLLNQHLILFVY